MEIPTPHIGANKKSLIADTVLMPGDPLRAKSVAEKYLDNVVLFSSVRNMLGYTGEFEGKPVSIMGSGMGMPSCGIYSYELFKFYDVKSIIRTGSCGAYSEDYDVYDIILAEEAWSESSFAKTQSGDTNQIQSASETSTTNLERASNQLGYPVKRCRIHSTDVFYRANFDDYKMIRDAYNCSVVEMEAFALFSTAKWLSKNAAVILTVSDSLVTGKITSSIEREKSFTKMIQIALKSLLI